VIFTFILYFANMHTSKIISSKKLQTAYLGKGFQRMTDERINSQN
jgi:hypothetical protein